MDRKKCSLIVVNDLFEELTNENKRLVNQLVISTKYVNKLIEFKNTFDLYSNKFKQCLESNEWQKFEKLFQEINEINNSNEHNVEEITNDIKSEESVDSQLNPMKSSEESDHLIQSSRDDESNRYDINSDEDNVEVITNNIKTEPIEQSIDSQINPMQCQESEELNESPKDNETNVVNKQKIIPTKKKRAVPVRCNVNTPDPSGRQIISCPESGCNYKSYVLFNIRIHQKITHGLDVDLNDAKSDQKTKQTSIGDKRELMRQKMASRRKMNATNQMTVDQSGQPASDETSKELIKCGLTGCRFESRYPEVMSVHRTVHEKRLSHSANSQDNETTVTDEELKFACSYIGCNFRTSVYYRLRLHKRRCQSLKPTKSDVAKKAIQDRKNRNVETTSRTLGDNKVMAVKCHFNDCGKLFETRRDFNFHAKYVHSVDVQQLRPSVQSADKTHSCAHPDCDYRSNYKSSLSLHMRCHMTEEEKAATDALNTYKCSYDGCDKRFPTYTKLRYHVKYRHLKNSEVLKCKWSDCQYKTHNPEYMRGHVYNCHMEKKFVCDHPGCGQGYYKVNDLVFSHIHTRLNLHAVSVMCVSVQHAIQRAS